MSVRATARRIIKSRQIEGCSQLKTACLLLLRDRDCGEQFILRRRHVGRIAREPDLAAQSMQEGVAPVFSCLTSEGQA